MSHGPLPPIESDTVASMFQTLLASTPSNMHSSPTPMLMLFSTLNVSSLRMLLLIPTCFKSTLARITAASRCIVESDVATRWRPRPSPSAVFIAAAMITPSIDDAAVEGQPGAPQNLQVCLLRQDDRVGGPHGEDPEAQVHHLAVRPADDPTRDGRQRKPTRHPRRHAEVVVEVREVGLQEVGGIRAVDEVATCIAAAAPLKLPS